MQRKNCRLFLTAAAVLTAASTGRAEPNEDFFDATELAPGVTEVSGEIFGSPEFDLVADTTLGAFDEFGDLIEADDDSSDFGTGTGSGLFGIPVNADGSIDLAVSGFEDFDFDGIDDDSGFDHTQEGEYDLIIDVFDASGGFIDFIDDFGALETGAVDGYFFSDPAWIGGTFDAQIDNFPFGVFEPGDVDFYRFTDLPAGFLFVAEVTEGDFDSILGLFDDETGAPLDIDDDGGEDLLSAIVGIVPDSGELVLAVTGFEDFSFIGAHEESGAYTLTVFVIPEPSTLALGCCAALAALPRRRDGR